MPPKAKTKNKAPYHHGNLRGALTNKALKLIEQRGNVSFTLREIAARAGVSHAAAYRHFPDKRGVLSAVAEEGFRLMAGEFETVLHKTSGQTNAFKLRELGQAYVAFALRHPGHFRAMFHSELADRTPFPALQQAAKEAFSPLRSTIEAGMKAKEFRSVPVEVAAIAAWSLVHGFASLVLERHVGGPKCEPVSDNGIALAIIRLLQEGLLEN